MKSVVFCPNTGSGILLQNEIYDLQEYLVSYGGGMGGANVRHYGKTIAKADEHGFIVIATHKGEEITLNTRYIVYQKPMRLVKVVSDDIKTANYRDDKYEKYINTIWYKLYHGEKAVFSDEYHSGSFSDFRDRSVSTDLEAEYK